MFRDVQVCETEKNFKEWLLAIAVILAPMTGFRIWKIGPAEVLVLFWVLINIDPKIPIVANVNKLFLGFWGAFLVAIFLGSIWGTTFYPSESNMSGILTWCYFAVVSILVLTLFEEMNLNVLIKVIKEIAIGTSMWYMMLYVYSKNISSTFFGAPLWYYGSRFSGGATNPHQVAMLLGVATVISLYFIIIEKTIGQKILYICCCSVSFFLLLETTSSTGLMATICASIILIYCETIGKLKNKGIVNMFILAFIVLLLLLTFDKIWTLFMDWVASDVNGMDRFDIFSTIGIAFLKDPIFGLGPGTHGRDGIIELHNAYLEILAMSGIVGTLIFAYFTGKVFISAKQSTLSLSCITCFYIFGLAGFSVRRLLFWIIVPMLYSYSQKINDNDRDEFSVGSED